MRFRAVAVVMVAMAAATLACSSDDPEVADVDDRDEAIDAIAEDLRDDLGPEVLDEEAARCLGSGLVDALGVEGALELHRSPTGLSGAPEATVGSVREVVDDCVPGSAVAPGIVAAFYASVGRAGAAPQEVVDCVAGELDGGTGAVLAGGDASDAAEATLPTLEACLPDELVVDILVEAFVDGGATPEQARCTAEALGDQLTLSQLQAVTGTDELPAEVEAVLGAATEACL